MKQTARHGQFTRPDRPVQIWRDQLVGVLPGPTPPHRRATGHDPSWSITFKCIHIYIYLHTYPNCTLSFNTLSILSLVAALCPIQLSLLYECACKQSDFLPRGVQVYTENSSFHASWPVANGCWLYLASCGSIWSSRTWFFQWGTDHLGSHDFKLSVRSPKIVAWLTV